MKKIFTLIVAALAFAGNAKALDYVPESGFSFQAVAGMNVSNVTNQLTSTNAKPGFNLGVRAEYMLPSCYGVFVNLGVNYTMKGFKEKFDAIADGELPATSGVIRANACYIEIPLHIGYRYNISDKLGVYADFGPYVAIGTNGKFNFDYDDDKWDDFSKRYFRNDETGDLQRADFGLGYRIGAEYANHHSLTLGMDWGLTDLYRDEHRKNNADNEYEGFRLPKIHNFNCSITYGYRF